jgi:type I restriction enzyme M protein
LFYSTGIPVCILILKKCKKHDDVLFINAAQQFKQGKRQNTLRVGENGEPNDILNIVDTYKFRPEKVEKYARRVSMDEIEKNGYNLNISRYVSTSEDEVKINLNDVNERIIEINEAIKTSTDEHNKYLKELGLPNI